MITSGDLIFHRDPTANNWVARVSSVNGDQVVVVVTENNNKQYHEIWSLQETIEQLRNEEYLILGARHV